MTRRGQRRRLVASIALLAVGLGGLSRASAAAPSWSIVLSGTVDGTAARIKPECFASSTGNGPLIARATFALGDRRMRISIYFAAPTGPATRPFAPTPGPDTVFVSVNDVTNPSAVFTSAAPGSGSIAADRRSGAVNGTLVGPEGEISVDAAYACPKLATSRGTGSPGSPGRSAELAPGFEGSLEATTSGHCTGTERGSLWLRGVAKHRVRGAVFADGSYTCEGITVPTSGGMILSGTFKNGTLRLGVDELLGLLLAPPSCLVGQQLTIRVRDGGGSASPAYTAPSGDLYECTFSVEKV